MAFSDYKNIAQVQIEFSILYEEANFIMARATEPPRHFVQEFEFNRLNIDIFSSEAARTEMVIGPILREVYKGYTEKYAFWVFIPTLWGAAFYLANSNGRQESFGGLTHVSLHRPPGDHVDPHHFFYFCGCVYSH
jgi:hypothetical protein